MKQETLEEAAEKYAEAFDNRFWVSATFKEGAKWQAERSYSEEDMIKFTEWCIKSNYVYYFNGLDWTWGNSRTQHYTTSKELLISWKEQFKK